MEGHALLEVLAEASGLPSDLVQQELIELIKAQGKNEKAVTLDDLREILAAYLQDVLVQAKEDLESA